MPTPVYKWYFGAHGLKSFEWNILRFVGIAPHAQTLIGKVAAKRAGHVKWIERIRLLGRGAR